MEEEILRRKYIKLKSNILNIRNKISNLNSYNNKLINLMDDTIIVNDKTFKNEEFNYIDTEIQRVVSEINNNIIPSINRKI